MRRREFLKGAAVAGSFSAVPSHLAHAQADAEARTAGSAAPATERYAASSRVRSGLALGGIGAGYFEIRKNGRFYDWNIANNSPKETGPRFVLPDDEREDRMAANLFFEARYQVDGGPPRMKLLQIDDGLFEGAEMGIAYSFPWLKAVKEIQCHARFPLATLTFHDDEMPFALQLEAWSSFIPHDVKNSSLPLVFFDFTATSVSGAPCEVTLLMTARNFTGYATVDRFYTTAIERAPGRLVVEQSSGGMDEKASSWGQIAIGSLSQNSTYYAGWAHRHPFYEQALRHAKLPDIDDTLGVESAGEPAPAWLPATRGRNSVDPATGQLKVHDPDIFATIAHTVRLAAPGSSAQHSFLYAWNFPNLYNETAARVMGDRIEGHYYSNFFTSAREVIAYGAANRQALKQKTLKFLEDFFASDADVALLEQVNSQLNTFFTSGRLVKSGDFGILEGLSSTYSWGPIATIDVMLYGTAPIIALFPQLQQSTMRCHARAQLASGEIEHGLQKDFGAGEDNTAGVQHRVDLPGQFAILALRDFFWTNDLAYLRELFPAVKKAIEYVLRERSKGDGAMPITSGIETSYDNFPMNGHASYLLSQWICALNGAAEGADALADMALGDRYRKLAAITAERMNTLLWNGSYYRLYAQPGVGSPQAEGCLTDQLVGQWAARCSGLASLLPGDNIRSALKTILTRNYEPDIGLKNCSFRADGQLSEVDRNTWNDQANTCWSGVELAFAALLIYEGLYDEGVTVARTVDRRYRENGLYFNHQEFGGHYFRPMSAWSLINAMLGFSLHCGQLSFDPKLPKRDLQLFFATPTATARYIRRGATVRVECLTGILECIELCFVGGSFSKLRIGGASTVAQGKIRDGVQSWRFESMQSLGPGQTVELL